jgi:hypothetical protein
MAPDYPGEAHATARGRNVAAEGALPVDEARAAGKDVFRSQISIRWFGTLRRARGTPDPKKQWKDLAALLTAEPAFLRRVESFPNADARHRRRSPV